MKHSKAKRGLLVALLIAAGGPAARADGPIILAPSFPSMPSLPSAPATPELSTSSTAPGASRDMTLDNRAAIWREVDDTGPWTETVLAAVHDRLPDLEKAKDVGLFCPGYAHATVRHQTLCWLRLIGAIASFESDFIPDESFLEPSGNYSVGLLSLSPHECKNAPTIQELKNPRANLECGVQKMADLIGADQYIDGPGDSGAAGYWSTLRSPYLEGKYHLGKKPQVIEMAHTYDWYD